MLLEQAEFPLEKSLRNASNLFIGRIEEKAGAVRRNRPASAALAGRRLAAAGAGAEQSARQRGEIHRQRRDPGRWSCCNRTATA